MDTWIRYLDRLPKTGKEVLLCADTGFRVAGRLNRRRTKWVTDFWDTGDRYPLDTYPYWMPFPELDDPGWIKCDEKMPETDQGMSDELFFIEMDDADYAWATGPVKFGAYYPGLTCDPFWGDSHTEYRDVKRWQPLPEAPLECREGKPE